MPDGELLTIDLPRFKTPYNHDTRAASLLSATYNKEPSKTKQEFKDETDINTILARFTRANELPPAVLPEHFTDLTTRLDYFTMQTRIAKSQELFYRLSATTRSEFQNDPTRWADTVVQAVKKGDVEHLRQLGIHHTPKPPQEANKETPAHGSTPVPKAPPTPPGDPKPGETPSPPSDKRK